MIPQSEREGERERVRGAKHQKENEGRKTQEVVQPFEPTLTLFLSMENQLAMSDRQSL